MLDASFLEHFARLEDPRVTNHNSRHEFMDILVMGFVGNLCGCDDWDEIVDFCHAKKSLLAQILELPEGIPSYDTIQAC